MRKRKRRRLRREPVVRSRTLPQKVAGRVSNGYGIGFIVPMWTIEVEEYPDGQDPEGLRWAFVSEGGKDVLTRTGRRVGSVHPLVACLKAPELEVNILSPRTIIIVPFKNRLHRRIYKLAPRPARVRLKKPTRVRLR